MPATILPFKRLDTEARPASCTGGDEPVLPRFPMYTSKLTSRDIAHRWAMLAHLTRRYPRRASTDPIR